MTLALALAVACSLGATPLTLQQAREQSRSNTQALQAQLGRRQADASVDAARSALLPQVSASAGASGQYAGPQRFLQNVPELSATGETIWRQMAIDVEPAARASFSLSLVVQQLIYDATRWSNLAQAGAQAEAAAGQQAEERDASELEAIRRFYELLKAQRTMEVLQKRVQSSEQLVERARVLFAAGRMKKEEEISAAVNLGTDRISVLRQQAAVTSAQTGLASWLSRDPDEELAAEDPGAGREGQLAPSYAQAVQRARTSRPLLKATAAQVRAAKAGVEVQSGASLPTVSAYGRFDRGGPDAAPFFTDVIRQNSVSGGVNLSWSLFSGFGIQSLTEQARLQLSRAELTYTQTERDVASELRRELASLEAMVQVLALSKSNLALAKDGLTLATSRFDAGDASTLLVRDAQVKLTQAELSVLESRVDVEVARAALERSMGTLGDSP